MAFYAEAGDIARLAMDIEDAGQQFYNKLASSSTEENAKNLFTYLANQEEQHKLIFGAIMQQTSQEQKQGEYVIDIVGQMRTMIDDLRTFVFNNQVFATGTGIDLPAAVTIAIHAEEESVRIYSEMKRVLTETFAPVLEKIISEEQKHLKILQDFQQTLQKTN
jgi:rubrerythrin